MRRHLTDRNIASLPTKAKRYIVYDSVVPSLGIRVGKRKIYVVVGRFNGNPHPTRHSLGPCDQFTLDEAREKARARLDRTALVAWSFGSVAEQFFRHIQHQRRAYELERNVRREFAPLWSRPLLSITRRDVLAVIDATVARGSPCAAHHHFAYVRRIFNWAIGRGILEHSPCDRVKACDIIGPKVVRQRTLSDDELRKLWSACERIGYPYGPLWQLLLVTGQRKSEIAHARRSEISGDVLTIPPERFKSNATHLVPLSSLALEIIARLPQEGPYLFSTTQGRTPVNGFSKAKRRLDKLMGDVPPWVIHDLRRTVRTRLSALRVPEHIAELVIGHSKRGLARVYDQHRYQDEMREALELWATELARIVACQQV